MADQRLTDRTELSAAANDSDLLHVVDVSDTTDNASGTSKKITVTNLIKSYVEALTSYYNKSTDTSDVITAGSTNLFMTSAERTKLSGIETAADVTDETNVTSALDGATLTGVTVATGDKVMIQDVSDSDNLKTVTAQAIADLASGGSVSDTAYGVSWNGDTSTAASKNAIYDKIEALDTAKADASHTHATTDITSGTFADARIAASNVTQHQASLSITESQISDLGTYETAAGASTLTNKTIDGDNNTISNLDLGNEVDWAAIGDVTDRSAFASGDKVLIFEAGVGMRKVDYDDLPGAGGGLSNVVEDTTPQLGGDLDLNSNNITAAGPTTISSTEVSYLDGVSSNIQTQIDAAPDISSGAGAPGTTPSKIGDIYVNTSDNEVSLAAGTSSSADWKNIFSNSAASTTSAGEIELATSAEVTTGTDTARAITPDALRNADLTINDINIDGEVGFNSQVDNGNSGSADTIDWTTGNMQKSTLTANCTYTFTAPTKPGRYELMVVQDATGSRTVTWPAAVKWPGGTAPTLSTGANAVDIVTFSYDGTSYHGVDSLNFS